MSDFKKKKKEGSFLSTTPRRGLVENSLDVQDIAPEKR